MPSAPVRLVVLFGSSARGSARPDSDVDLGFLPDRDLTLGDELALQRRFEVPVEKLGRILTVEDAWIGAIRAAVTKSRAALL